MPGDGQGVPWCHSWCASTHWMGRKVDLDDYEEVIMMMMRMMFEMLDTMLHFNTWAYEGCSCCGEPHRCCQYHSAGDWDQSSLIIIW